MIKDQFKIALDLVSTAEKCRLHDLVLGETASSLGAFHGIHVVLIRVFGIGQAKGTAAILITGELFCTLLDFVRRRAMLIEGLTNGSVGISLGFEFDDTCAARTTIGLILDLGALNRADSREELNEILVTSRPGQVANVD